MKVRIDKCSTFGMRKQSGNYMQFQPMLTIGGKTIPAIENGGSFKYLGKIFDYDMKNNLTKTILVDRLKNLLKTTSELDVKPQRKMKILNLFIPNQLKFELRMYDISYTWITQKLDILSLMQLETGWNCQSAHACQKCCHFQETKEDWV